ncbi:metalloprotease [Streptomyces sp. NPDC101150]|uniref:metalloprotease n=1 Tax=Streptomyces sp. NPDC101150 TaxID=3366114 RepID=UPI0037F719F0
MTPAPELLEQRPAVRPEIVLGPVLRRGPAQVCAVWDPRRDRRYELSGRLRFVMGRLDGRRTLADVGEEYRSTFGVRLDEQGWVRILTALGSRRLLTAGPDEAAPPSPPAEAPYPRTLRYGRVVLGDPSALLERWTAALRPVFTRVFFGCATAVFLAALIAVGRHWQALTADATALLRRPVLLLPVVLLLAVSTVLHELAHGMAARQFGGAATEIGIAWFLPAVFPYCKVEGVSLFPSRGHRAATAFAGVFANLAVLLPFCVLWWCTAPGGALRPVAAGFLLAGVLAAAGNLLPLPGLDGYQVLGAALNMSDLSAESRRYLRLLIRKCTGGPDETLAYPRWTRRVYGGYPLLAVGSVGAFVVALVAVCFRVGTPVVGATAVAAVVSLVTAAILGALVVRRVRAGAR